VGVQKLDDGESTDQEEKLKAILGIIERSDNRYFMTNFLAQEISKWFCSETAVNRC
jgi:hypothetical protein